MNEYKYQEYRKKAIEYPTEENLNTLAEWLFMWGGNYWNGEAWDIDNGMRLYPIYDENGNIIKYEIR